MATGSYTGDGSSSRAIAGIGFQPSVVIIKGNASIEAILRTSSMSGDNSKKLGSNDVFFAGGVISLDADGFTLGSNNRVNAAVTTYYWIAFKEDAMSLKVSTYTGNDVDNHVITGVGFTPAAVLVFRDGASNVSIKTSSMASNDSKLFYSTSTYTDRVKTLMADGFTLGTSAEVNAIGDTYHYVAWKAVAGSMQTGSYDGDDTDDRNITAPGFKPSYVITVSTSSDWPLHHPASLGDSTDDTLRFISQANTGSNYIQALISNGFQVGAWNNASTITYHWLAFAPPVPSFRAAASAGVTSGTTSLTISKPAGTTSGDVMIAAIAFRLNTVTIIEPSGWTLIRRTNSTTYNTNSQAIYRSVAGGSEPASYSWTFGGSPTGAAGGIMTFTGVDTATPVNVENGRETALALTLDTPSVTTTVDNTILVTAHSLSSSATWTPPAGMTEAVDVSSDAVPLVSGISLELSYVTQSSAGPTGTKTATASNDADSGVAQILALRAPLVSIFFTVTYTAGANGSITGTSPQTVNHGRNGTAATAVPNTGYYFVDWSDSSTDNPRTDTNVTGNISVTANFAINTYTLTYFAGANGSISGTSPQMVNYGANGAAVTAVPATGYHFVSWSDASTDNPRTDPNVTGNISVTASFAINQYTLTYTANSNGSITGTSPQTVNHGASGSAVTAVPATGYHFVQWSDGVRTPSRTDSNVTANITATASFAINTYTLTYYPGAHGLVSGTTPQIVNQNASGTAVTAIPVTGYHFVNWSDGLTANPRTDKNVTADLLVTAGFANNQYTLMVNHSGSGSVLKDPNQSTCYYGDKITLTAAAAPGWTFVGWGGDLSGNENPKFISMDSNKSVTATFRLLHFLPLVIGH